MSKFVSFDLAVRPYECDMQGVVFNAHYYAWADMAVVELFKAVYGGYGVLLERGFDTVVVSSQCEYRAPAYWPNDLTLDVTVPRVGTKSFDVETTVRRGAETLAKVTATQVFVKKETLESAVPPDDVRRALERARDASLANRSSSVWSERAADSER